MKLLDYVDWKPDRMLADITTIKTKVIAGYTCRVEDIRSISESLLAMSTRPLPVEKVQANVHKKPRDYMLWFVLIVASVMSVCATAYYYNAHDILLYEDARSHMRISRSFFDSLTPGFAQLGSVWLPLPHVLMWPFIWNDFLWHSGLAGSLIAMPCYVIACLYIYLIARRITGSTVASLLGVLVFALNANILYLQSTPLSELVCIATYVLSVYCVLMWVDTDSLKYLVFMAIAVMLATLARYDSWPLAIATAFVIPISGILKKKKREHIVAETLTYAVLGFFGITLWLIWNKMIFGDALYFARGPYSSFQAQLELLHVNHLFTYHNVWSSLKTYSIDTIQTIGIPLTLCTIGCLCLTFLGKFSLQHKLVLLLLLTPFAFYVYSLYGGNAAIWIPGANPQGSPLYLFNTRYGAQMVAPAAIFFATGISIIQGISWNWLRGISWLGIVGLVLIQSLILLIPGGIALQDGQYAVACAAPRTIDAYMYQHYDRGLILNDVSTAEFDTTSAGIDFKNVVYEGSYQYWGKTIAHPERYVAWVVVNPLNITNDLVAQHIKVNDRTFTANFTLVAKQSDGGLLFHRSGLPPLPNRAPLPQYSYPHHACVY